jgi:signal transduction histidine kinase
VKRYPYRTRLFLVLVCFALAPTVLLTMLWAGTLSQAVPLLNGSAAWERAAATGERALAAARRRPLTPAERHALDAHEQELRHSLELSTRSGYLLPRAARLVFVAGVLGAAGLFVVASRVAGHLSRQLSRPLDQLVRWTELIQAGQPLPDEPEPKGAPEFGTLRGRMRVMARELALGRERELEAERVGAFRETARRVAHELKNPLTPIRFAVERLRRDADAMPPGQADAVEVLATETARLEEMARSFAQFGRLPEGPAAEVDLAEMARRAAKTTIPEHLVTAVEVDPDVPLVRGHYGALSRALANVLLNAVDACDGGAAGDVAANGAGANGVGPNGGGAATRGAITIRISRARAGEAVELAVRDSGCGIPPERLARIWEPYVTHKAHGTGLGLAIARQTVAAHGGTVDAVSAVGRGTEIRFILPVAGPPATLETAGA